MIKPQFFNIEDLRQEPIERAETLPSALYTQPESLLLELPAIFQKSWQLAGHISQIPSTGDSLCISIAENPVIVLRDGNQIRAFYNVCKHRGGPVSIKKGTTSVMQCGYHGWTYKLDGSLRGVPQFDRVELFDKQDFGLVPVNVSIWQGLIFINLHEDPEITTDTLLAGISERISPLSLDSMQYHSRTVDLIECNWKVYIDNFLEGYHIPVVHPELATLLDYKNYLTETSETYSLQYSPFSSDKTDNPYNAENGEAFYYFIYPNIMFNILPGRLQTNIVEAVGHNKCRVIFDFLYSDIKTLEENGTIASDIAYSKKIQQEDIEICEAVQKGLGSLAYDKGRFSVKREAGVYHFQSLYKTSIAQYLNLKL
jgi:choline monooxygenase